MRALALFVVGALAITACSDGSDADDSETTEAGAVDTSESADDVADLEPSEEVGDHGLQSDGAASIEWGTCENTMEIPGLSPLECATIVVPLDYSEPDRATIPIALARQAALDPANRIGSLVFNPGGPGGSGIDFLSTARVVMPDQVAERFDLVAFDPRGVGASAAVQCDLTRDDGVVLIDDDDREAWNAALDASYDEIETCTSDPAGIEPFVGTNNAARDLDQIREAIGDDQLTYVGYSYGTRLGATYAALFPDNVRALVLDGGLAPTDDFTELGEQQADGFDLALDHFAAACDADPDCAVSPHGETLDVLAQLQADIAAAGSFPTDDPARILTPGELDLGVIAALYSKSTWNYLAIAMHDAASEGDGTIFQVLADLYLGRELDGRYTNQVEAGAFINCADDPSRPPEDEVWAAADAIADRSDHFGDDLRASFGCLGLPAPIDPLIIGDGEGAAPILVIGTTGDPATPYDWSSQLAESLESGVLYSVDGEGHTAYTSIECVTPVVNSYLIDLEVPESGAGCVDDSDTDPFPPAGESEAELVAGFFACLIENGADVEPLSIADVLRDPTGETLLGGLELDDPSLLGALLQCESFLTG